MEKIRSQFGSWSSPISSDLIVNETVSLGQLSLDGEDIYWIEGRPSDGGRQVLVKRTPDGNTHDITPSPYSCRSLVHEYGGSAYLIADEFVYFSNYHDQNHLRHRLLLHLPEILGMQTACMIINEIGLSIYLKIILIPIDIQ